MILTPRTLYVVEQRQDGRWTFRHAKTGAGPGDGFPTAQTALEIATKLERVTVGRLLRRLRARRATEARRVRDLSWRGCAKRGGAVAWLPRDGKQPEGWYLVLDLPDSYVEVPIEWCPWCGNPLDLTAGPRGQNAFEIVQRQPLKSFLRGEDIVDWPDGYTEEL